MGQVNGSSPRVRIPALKQRLSRDLKIAGKKVFLRPVRPEDATARYLGWLNDREVNRQTESRYEKTTLDDLRKYVGLAIRSPSNFFFAIVEKSSGKHIGNIKIDSAVTGMWDHLLGEVGLMIGDKSCWGKGYASEAIRLLKNFAFRNLKLHKLTAQCYSTNAGSARAFLKAGFKREGVRRSHVRYGGKYVDLALFGVINPSAK
jgi:RimJ/RimL family protein N-acetyltransferase